MRGSVRPSSGVSASVAAPRSRIPNRNSATVAKTC